MAIQRREVKGESAPLKLNSTRPENDVSRTLELERYWDRYDLNVRFGIYWRNCASDFHAAALLLFHIQAPEGSKQISPQKLGLGSGFCFGVALPRIALFNAALSLELLLKACVVKRDGHASGLRMNHRLADLAKDADLKLPRSYRYKLDFLTEHLYWRGRYPAPKSREEYDRSGHITRPGKGYVDAQSYQELWKSFTAHYEGIAPARSGDW